MTVDNATAESVDVITDALLTASRLLVAISARSIALVRRQPIPVTRSATSRPRGTAERPFRGAPTN
jgi:hypothetical protein